MTVIFLKERPVYNFNLPLPKNWMSLFEFRQLRLGNPCNSSHTKFAVYIRQKICVKKVSIFVSILLEWMFCVNQKQRVCLNAMKEFTGWAYIFSYSPGVGSWLHASRKEFMETTSDRGIWTW